MKVDEIRFKAIISMLQVLLPQTSTDDENRANLIDWAQANANANESLFPQRLDLDIESLKANRPQQPQGDDPGGGMML